MRFDSEVFKWLALFIIVLGDLGSQVCAGAVNDSTVLYLGLQLHIEPQQWSPYDGEANFRLAAQALDRLAGLFESHGFPITVEVGLGFAQSSLLWGADTVPGSVQNVALRGHEIAVHIHFPVSLPGFRGIFWPEPEPEDTIPESELTYEQYCSAVCKRKRAVDTLLIQPTTGECGAWSSRPELDWVRCMEEVGFVWVSGWKDASRPGHAWDTRVVARRVGMDMTQDYTGGVLDYFYDGPVVFLPDGSVSGSINPTHGASLDDIINLMEFNLQRVDPNRFNVAYLTTHLYEFIHAGQLDSLAFVRWDSLLDRLDQYVAQGKVQYVTFGEMYNLYCQMEHQGYVPYPYNGSFETPDTTITYEMPQTTETMRFYFEWMDVSDTIAGAAERTDEESFSGTYGFKFAHVGDVKRTITPGIERLGKLPIYAKLPAGVYVTYNVWYKGMGPNTPGIAMAFYDTNIHEVDYPPYDVVDSFTVVDTCNGWQKLQLNAIVPDSAQFVRIFISFRGDGIGYFDDVTISYQPAGIKESNLVNVSVIALNSKPNPFTRYTVITYYLPVAGNVQMRIYDTGGRMVRKLVDGWQPRGIHNIVWCNDVPAGTYFINLSVGEKIARVKKIVVVR